MGIIPWYIDIERLSGQFLDSLDHCLQIKTIKDAS